MMFLSVQFSCSVLSDSLQPRGLQRLWRLPTYRVTEIMGEQKKKPHWLWLKNSLFSYFLTINHQQPLRQEICKTAASTVEGKSMFSLSFQFFKHYISYYINYTNDKFLVSKEMIYT